MPQITPEVEAFARIKVLGIGGSGKNAINHMINSKVKGVEFIAVNTDAQDLHNTLAKKKIHIGKNLTRGLGTGMNAELGKRAVEETKEEVQEAIKGADMVFVTCGLGGGTGSGAAPIVAETAKELGALTVGVVTKPFAFEGSQRRAIADEALENLKDRVDTLITIPNDKLLTIIDRKTTLVNAFRIVDDVLRQGVQGISDLITKPGIVNVDFADVRAIMEDSGSALMGIGIASGDNRAIEAAKAAINSPLLELSIDGAKGVLFNISGSSDLTMLEINEAASIITENIDPNAKVIFGAVTDDQIRKGEIQITVIATGFDIARVKEPSAGLITNRANVAHSKSRFVSSTTEEVVREEEVLEETMSFPSRKLEQPVMIIDEKIQPRGIAPRSESKELVEDEDLEIPAFIRRKMKK